MFNWQEMDDQDKALLIFQLALLLAVGLWWMEKDYAMNLCVDYCHVQNGRLVAAEAWSCQCRVPNPNSTCNYQTIGNCLTSQINRSFLPNNLGG